MRNMLRMGSPKQRHQRAVGLDLLPIEPWGWRMKRAREDYAQLTLAEAVDEIGRHHLTSTGSISRMEDSTGVPRDPRRRALACIAAIVYGLDPAQFGVSSDDLPSGVAKDIETTRMQGKRPTKWETRPLVAA